ncbi:MAG: hypothetical protein ACI854_000755 [Arenicella sp.]
MKPSAAFLFETISGDYGEEGIVFVEFLFGYQLVTQCTIEAKDPIKVSLDLA